jgi:LysR family nitrogen assimilation transcriptional regulator
MYGRIAVELRHIRYFISVASLRSFSKAAGVLNVAQSALSRHVQHLEVELGTQLLFRTTRGVVPTEAGLRLIEMGETLLRYVSELRDEISAAAENPSGEVTIGMPQSISPVLAPLIIHETRRLYPKLSIHVTEGLSVFLTEWLNLGKIDLAVLSNFGESKGLRVSHLADEDLVLVAGPDRIQRGRKEIHLAELSQFPIILGAHFRPLIERAIKSCGAKLNIVMELDSIAIIKEIIVNQPFYSILPYASVHRDALNGDLGVVSIVDPAIRRELILAVNARRPLPAAAGLLRKLIIEKIKDIELQPRLNPKIGRTPRRITTPASHRS